MGRGLGVGVGYVWCVRSTSQSTQPKHNAETLASMGHTTRRSGRSPTDRSSTDRSYS